MRTKRTRHTPGPWHLADVCCTYKVCTRTGPILELKLASADGAADYDANARLIAKAPDLYTMLQATLSKWEDEESSVQAEHAAHIAELRALLAEIDGGPR